MQTNKMVINIRMLYICTYSEPCDDKNADSSIAIESDPPITVQGKAIVFRSCEFLRDRLPHGLTDTIMYDYGLCETLENVGCFPNATLCLISR